MDNAIILTIKEPKEPNKKAPNKKAEEEDILLDEAEKDIENEIQNLPNINKNTESL